MIGLKMESKVKKMGRPPAGVGPDGKPEMVRDYPKLNISIPPGTKDRLDAASALEKKPAWRIVERGIGLYIEAMSATDRKMVEAIATRNKSK
jgi:hypothetical protein